jgi:hypothetical protein
LVAWHGLTLSKKFPAAWSILSLTADNAVGFTGVPPADDGTNGDSGIGSSDSGAAAGAGGRTAEAGDVASATSGSSQSCSFRPPSNRGSASGGGFVGFGLAILLASRRRRRGAPTGCNTSCKENKPWNSCSVMNSCCPADDKEQCSYTATRDGTTKEFVCKSQTIAAMPRNKWHPSVIDGRA